jgi:hypothetical protein
MSGGALFVVLEVVEVLLVVLVVLEFSLVLDVEELVVDLHPITHATNNAKTSAVLDRGKGFIIVSFISMPIQLRASAVYITSSELLVNDTVSVYSWLLLSEIPRIDITDS